MLHLFAEVNLDSIKGNKEMHKTDQPTSYLKIYTKDKVISIDDYGLEGNGPLKEVYSIVYKY